jgi:hypothetical protein
VPERDTTPTDPRWKKCAGMIPTLALPGDSTPGQLGPISVTPAFFAFQYTRSMSWTGIPSVIAITVSIPASIASSIAAPANRAGTKIIEVLAPRSATASAIVSKIGIPSTSWPPLFGVTPATTSVPYSRLRSPWKLPSRPVSPEITSLVSGPTMIDIPATRS